MCSAYNCPKNYFCENRDYKQKVGINEVGAQMPYCMIINHTRRFTLSISAARCWKYHCYFFLYLYTRKCQHQNQTNQSTDKRMSFLHDCNLDLLLLLLFQSPMGFGLFDPLTYQAKWSIKDLTSSEKAREWKKNVQYITAN